MSPELSPIIDRHSSKDLKRSLGESSILLVIRSLENPASKPLEVIAGADKNSIVLSSGMIQPEYISEDSLYIDTSEPYSSKEVLKLRRAHGFLFVVAKVLSEESGHYPIIRANAGTEQERDIIACSYGSALHQIQDNNEIVTLNKIVTVLSRE